VIGPMLALSHFLERQESDRDEVPDCPMCKRTADYFEQSDSFSSESHLHCYLSLGKVTVLQSRISCATCQSIMHLLDDQICPDSKEGGELATFCELCIVRLCHSKAVPQGYGYYVSLEVSNVQELLFPSRFQTNAMVALRSVVFVPNF
jgi:hypothetical protein